MTVDFDSKNINAIVSLYEEIISTKTVGSRYEGNDFERIWELGDCIQKNRVGVKTPDLLILLRQNHRKKELRYDDRLYRAAIIFRQYWDLENDFIDVTQILNAWTKLRELYPICEGVLTKKSTHTKDDVQKLIKDCDGLTYLETREVFKRFRSKDDSLMQNLGVDKYEILDAIQESIEILHKVIKFNDQKEIERFREKFTDKELRGYRLFLSAIQNEEVFKRYEKEIKKSSKTNISEENDDVSRLLHQVFSSLQKVITHGKSRVIMRNILPANDLGTLGTYLKALESDKNMEEYKNKQNLLEKFLGHLAGE